MTESTNSPDIDPAKQLTVDILSAIGSLAMRWNASEMTIRHTLRLMNDRGWLTRSLEPKPSVKQMLASLKEVSGNGRPPPGLATPLAHLRNLLETVQSYRNFYLHEIGGPFGIDLANKKAVVFLYGEQATTSGLEQRFGEVTAAEIRLAEGYCRLLGEFTSDIAHHILMIAVPPLSPLPALPPPLVLPTRS